MTYEKEMFLEILRVPKDPETVGYMVLKEKMVRGTIRSLSYVHTIKPTFLVFVHPRSRGKGIGLDLTKGCVNFIKSRNFGETIYAAPRSVEMYSLLRDHFPNVEIRGSQKLKEVLEPLSQVATLAESIYDSHMASGSKIHFETENYKGIFDYPDLNCLPELNYAKIANLIIRAHLPKVSISWEDTTYEFYGLEMKISTRQMIGSGTAVEVVSRMGVGAEHPHMSSGTMCISSEGKNQLHQLAMAGDYPALFAACIAQVSVYTPDDAYNHLPTENREECCNCGDAVDEDNVYYGYNNQVWCEDCCERCEDCNEYLSTDDTYYCDGCSTVTCQGCRSIQDCYHCDMGRCERCLTECTCCDEVFCTDHIHKCCDCSEDTCQGCLNECNKCGQSSCDECYIICAICNKDFCEACSDQCLYCGKSICEGCTKEVFFCSESCARDSE